MNILVVDSDQDVVEMMVTWLRSRGFTVHFCFTADKARAAYLARKPDLVIADVSAGIEILEIIQDARAEHDAMVLGLTDELNDKVEAYCLESGADAVTKKPWAPKLLLAHIHALGRRVRTTVQRRPASLFTVGPIRFDAARNEVRINGADVHLTPTESRILQVLAINAGDVCTQAQIVMHAWGYGEEGDTYLIKAHIRNLREKIEPDPSKPRYIRTMPGVGYTLSAGTSSLREDGVPSRGPAHAPALDGEQESVGANVEDGADDRTEGDEDDDTSDPAERYAYNAEIRARRAMTGLSARTTPPSRQSR